MTDFVKKSKGTKITKTATAYTKAQIIASKKYNTDSDLVNAVLNDDKKYTIAQVDTLILSYKNKEVQ